MKYKTNFLKSILQKSNNPRRLFEKGALKMIYLNPKTYLYFRNSGFSDFSVDLIRYDGTYFVTLLKLMCNYKYGRNSFDFTSLADDFFKMVLCNKESIEIYGGNSKEVEEFVYFIRKKYDGINILGFDNGFKSNEFYINKISNSSADNVLLGLGSIKQEKIVIESKFNGKLITCGAFISQTSNSKDGTYYPEIYKKLGLLWFYRVITEKGHWKRLNCYPIFTFYFLLDFVRMNIWKK